MNHETSQAALAVDACDGVEPETELLSSPCQLSIKSQANCQKSVMYVSEAKTLSLSEEAALTLHLPDQCRTKRLVALVVS